MADAVGVAVKDGLVDGLRPPRLTRVDGQVEQVIARVVEGVEVVLGRVAGFAAGQVEGHDAALAVGHGEFGLAHRGALEAVAQAGDDQRRADVEVFLGSAQAVEHGVVDLFERQAFVGMEDRGVAHLQIPDVFPGIVLDQLVGHAAEGLFRLHHRQGVAEPGQVGFERLGLVDLFQESLQRFDVVGREQVYLPLLTGQLQQRRQA